MHRYLLRRLARRVLGEPRTPIRQELDHRQPIAPVEREYRTLDYVYGTVSALSLAGAIASLLLLATRQTC